MKYRYTEDSAKTTAWQNDVVMDALLTLAHRNNELLRIADCIVGANTAKMVDCTEIETAAREVIEADARHENYMTESSAVEAADAMWRFRHIVVTPHHIIALVNENHHLRESILQIRQIVERVLPHDRSPNDQDQSI